MAELEIVDVGALVAEQLRQRHLPKKGEVLREAEAPQKGSTSEAVEVRNPYPPNAIPARSLEEEDYVDAVSALIERDFFPDLPHLRARHELMQARLRGDNALAKALEKKLLDMPRPTPGSTPKMAQAGRMATPSVGNGTPPPTPLEHLAVNAAAARLSAWEKDDGTESVASANAGPSVSGQQQVLLRLTSGREVLVDLASVRLDEFQQVFTSEDNASFEAVLEKDRERRRQKEWWIESPELKHNTTCKQQALTFDVEEKTRPAAIMTCEFRARNTLYFKPKGEVGTAPEKPAIECRNTRFTSQEQSDLDETLMAAIAAKHARENGLQLSDVLAKMVKDGTFSIAALHNCGHLRAVGGRLETPVNQRSGQGQGFGFVKTPAMVPGENGFSPLMTFGKIASTPRVLDEEIGPSFRVAEESPRDIAAEKLARGAVKRHRDSKQNSKKERLKALGLTPNATPSTTRPTPASVASKVTPMTPIGQLLHRAQRMAQRGGRLRIGTSRPPTEEREAKRSRSHVAPKPAKLSKIPSSGIPASLMANLL